MDSNVVSALILLAVLVIAIIGGTVFAMIGRRKKKEDDWSAAEPEEKPTEPEDTLSEAEINARLKYVEFLLHSSFKGGWRTPYGSHTYKVSGDTLFCGIDFTVHNHQLKGFNWSETTGFLRETSLRLAVTSDCNNFNVKVVDYKPDVVTEDFLSRLTELKEPNLPYRYSAYMASNIATRKLRTWCDENLPHPRAHIKDMHILFRMEESKFSIRLPYTLIEGWHPHSGAEGVVSGIEIDYSDGTLDVKVFNYFAIDSDGGVLVPKSYKKAIKRFLKKLIRELQEYEKGNIWPLIDREDLENIPNPNRPYYLLEDIKHENSISTIAPLTRPEDH